MKTITTTIMLVCLIGLASAISYDIIAGEPQSIPLQENYVYYKLTGNSTAINYTVSNNGLNTIVTFDKHTPQGTYELKFYNEKGEEIQQQGGGGSRWSSKPKLVVVNETTINETDKIDNTTDKEFDGEIIYTPEEDNKENIIVWVLIIGGSTLVAILLYLGLNKS